MSVGHRRSLRPGVTGSFLSVGRGRTFRATVGSRVYAPGDVETGEPVGTPSNLPPGLRKMVMAGRADRFRSGSVAMSALCDRMRKPVGSGSAGGPRRFVAVDRSRRPQADADRQITAP